MAEPKTYTEESAQRELGVNPLQNQGFTKYVFRYFRDINEFVKVGKQYEQELLKEKNKFFITEWGPKERPINMYQGRPFVGADLKEAQEGPFYQKFFDEKALEDSIGAFKEILSEIDMGGAFKKAKLITTEKSTGIFDFGLASPGLYPLQEFYSKKLAEDHPFEFPTELPGIVPPLYVDKNEMDQFWYKSKSGTKYQMTKQQKGTEAVRLKIPGASLEFATSVKKVYVTFKREGGKANFVDLYVPCGGLQNMQTSGMLARALPVIMAARYFEMCGIRTRINAARTYYAGRTVYNYVWTIKDYGSDIDFQRIAIDTADCRFFRWNMWKYTCAINLKEFKIKNGGFGTTVYGGSLMRSIKGRWRNWYFEKMNENKVPYVNLKPELMIYGGLESPPNTWAYSGKDDYTFKRINQSFFKILDSVDFSFNKPSEAIQRIYNRKVMEGNTRMNVFQGYVSELLADAYTYPTKGDYATPKDVQVELRERFIQRTSDFAKYMQQLKTV